MKRFGIKWLCCGLLVILLIVPSFGQYTKNSMTNGSFELVERCPAGLTSKLNPLPLMSWFVVNTIGTPDLYSKCNLSDVGVPGNIAGYSMPHEGRNYLGLILGSPERELTNREILFNHLNHPLQENTRYRLTFFAAPASKSKYSVDSLSIAFLNDRELNQVALAKSVLKMKAPEDKGWSKVEIEYLAQGGESYLLMGDIEGKALMDLTLRYDGPLREPALGNAAYYYFDDFSLIPMDTVVEHGQKTEVDSLETFFNYNESILSDNAKTALSNLLEGLIIDKIHVKGYADTTGLTLYNKDLSLSRVMTIKDFLVSKNIDENRIQCMPLGESMSYEQKPLNRRCQIIVYYRKPTLK